MGVLGFSVEVLGFRVEDSGVSGFSPIAQVPTRFQPGTPDAINPQTSHGPKPDTLKPKSGSLHLLTPQPSVESSEPPSGTPHSLTTGLGFRFYGSFQVP